MSNAGAEPAAGPRRSAPLLARVMALVILSLVASQIVNLIVVLSVPPPAPDIYRISEVAAALRGETVRPRTGAPLISLAATTPPHVDFVGFYALQLRSDFSRALNVPEADLVIANEPPRWLGFRPTHRMVRQRLQRSGLPLTEHVLVAPFQVALRHPGRGWTVVRPVQSFPTPWQRQVWLSFLLSAAALTPFAYLFARRLAAPIAAFASAAERLGRDPGAQPLTLRGSAEVNQAVFAFNGMQSRLSRYVDDRTAMIGAVAHDLRTPLTRLRFRIESAPEPLRAKMAADIDQMDAMIAATLAFVRDASQPAVRHRLELSSLVESIADEMAETGLDVTAEHAGPVVIDGDPVGLRRLVTNLIDNAVKFGARARARVYAEDGAAVIEVDDDGPGLPEAERERVFEPFHRTERSRSRETGGAGLGLAVVRSVARAHGGDAVLANRPAGGLRARARLPL